VTCSHVDAEEINNDLRVFAKAKEAGHQMPWARFLRERIQAVYGLQVVNTAAMRHVRDCMGIR
jgi:hypothetical protein